MQIRVETAELERVASQVEETESTYCEKVNHLYRHVEELNNAWKGKDNLAFVNQINAYREDFHKVSTIMSQYVDFLRNSAAAYRDTQETLRSEAMRLQI